MTSATALTKVNTHLDLDLISTIVSIDFIAKGRRQKAEGRREKGKSPKLQVFEQFTLL
ncbi:hypothetical protein IQ264_12820 [Phormidium sp. LEGE 05292]|uniref:hypothetical protein n=1 Tax=[Phormidium] sp. LEGE 05292 TaxID=767427 RepID=UPI00187F5E1B|nr:hypothetical protein [Phormidium sp. LEGE 05292]MBE9226306.1 hypothetical protein [Phormidium sp. LEGE 05292]